MIGALSGTLLDRNPMGSVVVDVRGVGYEVQMTLPALSRLGEVGSAVQLRIHTRVREDAITLYGFPTADEKRAFDVLVAAHGVGPSVALALLSAYSPLELRQIIAMEDAEALSKVPGIGKKTAARMLVELKSKFDIGANAEVLASHPIATIGNVTTAKADVATALSGLGYGSDEVRLVIASLPDEGETSDLLRLALRSLAQGAR